MFFIIASFPHRNHERPERERRLVEDAPLPGAVEKIADGLWLRNAVGGKLDEYHRAACSVFEAAITDALRGRMGRA